MQTIPFASKVRQGGIRERMGDMKYGHPYPAQGYYQQPPVMAPPQYVAAPAPSGPGFLEACLGALCCCCLVDWCCNCCCWPDPFLFF